MFYLIRTKIALKTPLKTLKYPFSYTEYHHTKWRQRQTFERHNVQQRQRRTQRFLEQKDRRNDQSRSQICTHVTPCKPSSAFCKYCLTTLWKLLNVHAVRNLNGSLN